MEIRSREMGKLGFLLKTESPKITMHFHILYTFYHKFKTEICASALCIINHSVYHMYCNFIYRWIQKQITVLGERRKNQHNTEEMQTPQRLHATCALKGC